MFSYESKENKDPYIETERLQNILTDFYTPPSAPKLPKKRDPPLNLVQASLKNYRHTDALNFASYSSRVWKDSVYSHFRPLSKRPAQLHCTVTDEKIRAYYRVIAETTKGYVLSACHVNVHGYHRGDLRYIEVNDRTLTRGTEEYSCVGMLYLGDIVAVTGLARLKEFQNLTVSEITHDSDCIWMATNITVLPRTILKDAVFSILQNGTAVVKEQSEVMNVQTTVSRNPLEVGRIYTGSAFIPEKIASFFTAEHRSDRKNEIILKCSKIHQYPNSLGTIFDYKNAAELSSWFDIGTDAFKTTTTRVLFSSYNTPKYENPSEITETCVLMGYAAANSITNGRFDARSFPMNDIQRNGPVVKFSIDNPPEKPTEGKWTINSRIKISGTDGSTNATIETVILENSRRLRITARLSREVPGHVKFNKGIHIVSQREAPETQILNSGFAKKIPEESNGRSILEILYGAAPESYKLPDKGCVYFFPGSKDKIMLNQYQCDYVEMLLARPQIPMVVGSSPFGCGKSMTIVTAAIEIYKKNKPRAYELKKKQLLITQSNYASVNLVDISSKIPKDQSFKFVRYISEKNWKELADDCLTQFDVPKLMELEFLEWATGARGRIDGLQQRHMHSMLNFLLAGKLVYPDELKGQAFGVYHSSDFKTDEPWRRDLLEAFFMMYDPDVIMTTADSLQTLLTYNVLKPKEVVTIQIDEASQVPEYTFISLLTLFPYANYGLIGDIQQLPPYCETGLEGKLKDYGIGNTMERAVTEKLFPQAMLREVYRCHPEITGLLSDLFYDGKLISGITVDDRSEFMLKRTDFWPSSQYPVLVLNNRERGYKMGTSCGNKSEVQIVKNLLEILTRQHNGYQLKPDNIGVISFYAAQTSVLTESLRGKKVKCGTVDAFQGTERDVIILCCTNEKISEFMQLSNRINVAMSRAKQVTIIVGNVDGLKKAKYWGTIVREAEENGGVIDANSISSSSANNTFSQNPTRNRRNRRNSRNRNPLENPTPKSEPTPESKALEPSPAPIDHLADLRQQMEALRVKTENYKRMQRQ